MAKTPEFKVPKTLAQCADMLYTLREDRYAAQKIVAEFERKEAVLRTHLINTLPKSDASGISGKIANVKIETSNVPQVSDWEALYKHIKKTGAFELLQRRLGETAVKERWEAKKQVPGVGSFTAVKVSCTKR